MNTEEVKKMIEAVKKKLSKLEEKLSKSEEKGGIKPKRPYNRIVYPPGLSDEERKLFRSRICSLNYYYKNRGEVRPRNRVGKTPEEIREYHRRYYHDKIKPRMEAEVVGQHEGVGQSQQGKLESKK